MRLSFETFIFLGERINPPRKHSVFPLVDFSFEGRKGSFRPCCRFSFIQGPATLGTLNGRPQGAGARRCGTRPLARTVLPRGVAGGAPAGESALERRPWVGDPYEKKKWSCSPYSLGAGSVGARVRRRSCLGSHAMLSVRVPVSAPRPHYLGPPLVWTAWLLRVSAHEARETQDRPVPAVARTRTQRRWTSGARGIPTASHATPPTTSRIGRHLPRGTEGTGLHSFHVTGRSTYSPTTTSKETKKGQSVRAWKHLETTYPSWSTRPYWPRPRRVRRPWTSSPRTGWPNNRLNPYSS